MQNDIASDAAYDQLRQLAARNPRAARERFEELLKNDSDTVETLLVRMAAPGEGRLRQLVANFARKRDDKARFLPHFQQWAIVETDEFAKRAILSALEQTAPTPAKSPGRQQLVSRELVETYRYVSERLRHELQNALLGPRTRLIQIRSILQRLDEGTTRSEMEALVVQLRDELQSIGRLAEFEPNDEYFLVRPIQLCQWVQTLNSAYAKRFNAIDLTVEGEESAKRQRVGASDYLLRLIFWNLWVNAHQASGDPCSICLQCSVTPDALSVTLIDNGTGFPAEMAEVAFQDRFSKNGPHRGRGLLEVQDAMMQLHGRAQLVEHSPGVYRVNLEFPVAKT